MARVLAWTGGVLFVASLLYTVYFYGVTLGDATPPAPAALPVAVAVNLVLFGIFGAHHSIFARGATKRWIERVIPPRLERSFYVWIASLLLIAVWMLWRLVSGALYDIESFWKWPMYALQLAGVHLTLRAAGFLDFFELAGIRQLQPQMQHEPVFRTDGPFGLVRHPIYLGWILMTFATPAMTLNRLMFAVITTGYLVMAIPWEEQSLVTAFGERYRRYQSIVRWRLIPGVW